MKIRNICKAFLLLFLIFSLSACEKDINPDILDSVTTYSVTLYNGEEVVEAFDDMEYETPINLPVLEEEGKVFVGWMNEDDIYNNEYNIISDSILTAHFELAIDVFEYTVGPGNIVPTIVITGYTGDATYLKIPQMIDGKTVEAINDHAFEESDLIEVLIPMDVYIQGFAFFNSVHLKEVAFYGSYLLHEQRLIGKNEYDEIIVQNTDTCIIDEGSIDGGSWTFSEGCPIIEVISKSEPMIIGGVEFYTYDVILDKNDILENVPYSFGNFAFKGNTSLETVEIKKSDWLFIVSVFEGCPNLTNFIIDENSESYSFVEGVLYNKDLTKLLYYPNGLESTSFTLPENVESIRVDAFSENTTLETITIHKDYNDSFELWGLHKLNVIIVEENNQLFYTIDGVLYTDDTIVKYPASKVGSNYVLPENIKTIGESSFINNKYLETIDLGNKIITINSFAFMDSIMITELKIPVSCTFIDHYIVVDSGVDTIIINRSYINEGSITFLMFGFGRIDQDNFKIYVPDDSIDEYKANEFWKRYKDMIHPMSEYAN